MTIARQLAISTTTALCKVVSGAQGFWVGCEPVDRQRVYFANHSSHLDFAAIWSVLPRVLRVKTRPVAAKDYWQRTPLKKYLADHVFNAVLVERQFDEQSLNHAEKRERIMAAIDAMIEGMGQTHSLILFPEGTRSAGERIGDFKGGLYHIAKRRPEVELVPVFLENLNRILPKGEILPIPLIGSVTFGPPIQLGEDEKKAAFLKRARSAIENLATGANA